MRTKALLGLAVLAAGAVTCVAQSNVYSLNIVGYVNVPVQGGNKLTLLSNPLKPSNANYNITNTIVLPDSADGASLYQWGGTAWSSSTPGWVATFGWSPDATVNLGEAIFIQSPVATTVTFVGEVATGTNSYAFPKGISFAAPKVPVAAPFPGAEVGNDGDSIYLWTGSAWDSTPWGYLANFGWFRSGAADESTNGPVIPVGGGLVYQNGGNALSWTRTFNP